MGSQGFPQACYGETRPNRSALERTALLDQIVERDAQLIKRFEAEVRAAAQPVETASGVAATTHVPLAQFFKRHGHGELYEGMGYEETLPLLGLRDGGLLVEFLVSQDVPAPSWVWYLRALRRNDRGYIFLWLEPDLEADEPIIGYWEPYDDQQAFEACFVAAYQRHTDPITVASQLTLGPRVSRDLMTSALFAGLRNDAAELLLYRLDPRLDYGAVNPADYPLEKVRQFIERATSVAPPEPRRQRE